jgi:hypothetical protein
MISFSGRKINLKVLVYKIFKIFGLIQNKKIEIVGTL